MFGSLKRRDGARHSGASLVERHFVMQEERPRSLREVEIEALDPLLRSLLFTDGTVTRALGVQVLAPISVERLGQDHVPLPAAATAPLEAAVEEESVRRRVEIGIGEPAIPVLWAESYMIPDRLPPGFLGLLDSAPDGIGQSLQRVSLESSRELLWFGLDAPPEWAPSAPVRDAAALRRLYRVVSNRQPAILISEYFAVEQRLGAYRLAGLLAHESRQAAEEIA
jgi:chorismate-pyruvate lyase